MTREEDILNSFIGTDRIWPPFISTTLNHPFMKALVEVLNRLPDDAYGVVENYVSFVVEDDKVLATNVPFERIYPPSEKGLTIRFDTIVVFHKVLSFSHSAIVGFIAHEIAHSSVSKPNYFTDEEETDKLVRTWGFGQELDTFEVEKKE